MNAVVSVIGKDMVGILARVSTVCAEANTNVIEVAQSVLTHRRNVPARPAWRPRSGGTPAAGTPHDPCVRPPGSWAAGQRRSIFF